MKKFFISIMAVLGVFGAFSCSDMLETDSSRQVFDPELNSKTDSMFYAFGVMQAMQQLADQYVFLGELRGDLVSTTTCTDDNLRQIANFSVGSTANRYDSAYVYYRVINNCNYYIAHRDTTLSTGSTNVVMNEYAAMKAFRAWAYIQLARNYKKVPFFTEPLTSISQIDGNNFPEMDIAQIAAALGPDLAQYTGMNVPTLYGDNTLTVGAFNFGGNKSIQRTYCFMPVDVVLGELYLEAGEYAKAATYYTNYLITAKKPAPSIISYNTSEVMMFPGDLYSIASAMYSWSPIFGNGPTTDIITYIPMAVNKLRGVTTEVPYAFGYDLYASSSSDRWLDSIQIVASDKFVDFATNADYYYYSVASTGTWEASVNSATLGDMRFYDSYARQNRSDDIYRVQKYNYGNIVLYRLSTVYLQLAEALNRLGYPDAAFLILKEGINERALDELLTPYVSPETRTLLQTTYPFLSEQNMSIFTSDVSYGIHRHGSGVCDDSSYPGRSPYQYGTVVGNKLAELAELYGSNIGTTKQDTINAIEDIICDEYALEFAFEGRRFYDLCRLARHKNGEGNSEYTGSPAAYGANFGGVWLDDKIRTSNPNITKDLSDESNWYLPFTGKK